LAGHGVIVLRHRDELALCLIPTSSHPQSARQLLKRKESARRDNENRSKRSFTVPTLRTAHQWYDAHDIHTGVAGTPYDGTGVIVGFCDLGFDASHIAFQRPDGSCRVVRSVQYIESEGRRIVCDTPEAIRQWQTDRDTHTHATHVAGIMAGSYIADGLGGAAPGAEIVATTSELTEVGLLAGVEDIIEYAYSVGKPCVINLSVGNYLGPHDGTSLFTRYLDKCGHDAIICISSGNEGKSLNTFDVTFSETHPDMTFRLTSLVGLNLELYGAVDLWMSDDTAANIAPMVVDSTNNRIVCELPAVDFLETPVVLIVTDMNEDDIEDIPGVTVIHSPELAQYFKGNILLSGRREQSNGRYHACMEYDITTEIKTEGKPWGRYLLGGRVISVPGAHADIYADGIYSAFSKFPGSYFQPGSIHSVSDLAT
ncbi:MAG: S8 family serine peptidase, partial [Muribaculaceae bacterium]|nr:S8 family serine peptidase [Muribaculaceae bacterium]